MFNTLQPSEPCQTRRARPCRIGSWVLLVASSVAVGCSDGDAPTGAAAQDAGEAGAEADAHPLGACFQEHLEEAIALNESRKPKYAALTEGRSEAVSDTLIASETTSLLFARPIDEAAEPFHEAGVSIVCDEFVPMSGTPEFAERFAFDPEPITAFEEVDGDLLADELKAAFNQGGFAALSEYADASLLALETPRAYHCMLRHMLESLRRIANLAPVHEARASEVGMEGTSAISEDMVRLHFLSVGPAARLDAQAARLQSEGVPILCQDVPAIPAGP